MISTYGSCVTHNDTCATKSECLLTVNSYSSLSPHNLLNYTMAFSLHTYQIYKVVCL